MTLTNTRNFCPLLATVPATGDPEGNPLRRRQLRPSQVQLSAQQTALAMVVGKRLIFAVTGPASVQKHKHSLNPCVKRK